MYSMDLKFEDLQLLRTCVEVYGARLRFNLADSPDLKGLFVDTLKGLNRLEKKIKDCMERQNVFEL